MALSYRVDLLFRECPAERDCSLDEVRDFMTAATGGDFLSPERKADARKLRDIIFTAESLRHGVRVRRRKLPRKHFLVPRR